MENIKMYHYSFAIFPSEKTLNNCHSFGFSETKANVISRIPWINFLRFPLIDNSTTFSPFAVLHLSTTNYFQLCHSRLFQKIFPPSGDGLFCNNHLPLCQYRSFHKNYLPSPQFQIIPQRFSFPFAVCHLPFAAQVNRSQSKSPSVRWLRMD